ncbi:hypothetical protein OG988_40535 (plasmid) [Streptomyces zaomyceticus]|uniref:hypothetical protein n=1 Tax=Streptomyces zaomyceticus TaxID=68286 RepID=UPI002F915415
MSIDTKSWKAFAAAHAPDLTRTVFLPGLVTDPGHLARLIDDSLRTATRHAPGELRLRAFRPGAFDYRLTQRFVTTPPADGERAVDWLTRVAESDEECLAVNDVSAWNLELAAEVARIVGELDAEGVHELVSGTDVYTFVAHSGWTPFGIHKDSEPSLIFHLGPSPKEVFVWHDRPFDASGITPNPSFGRITFDIEEHLGTAERHLLQPGDFLCIPQDTYHVFRNLGPSAFLGLTPYPAKTRTLITEALWRATPPPAPLPPYPPARALLATAESLLTSRGHARTELPAAQPLVPAGTLAAPAPAPAPAPALAPALAPASAPAPVGVGEPAPASGPAPSALLARVAHELTLTQLRLRTTGHLSRPHQAALPRTAPAPGAPLRWARPGVLAAVPHPDGTGSILVARGRTVTVPGVEAEAFTRLTEATTSMAAFTLDQLAAALPSALDTAERDRIARTLHTTGAVIAR